MARATVVVGAVVRRGALVPLVVALATTVGGAVVGYVSVAGANQGSAAAAQASASFWSIVVRNLGAAALLYSGVCTAGVATLLAGLLLGGYVGATWAAAVTAVGLASAGGSIIWYAPLEMIGLLLAATAGLTPASAVFTRQPDASRTRAYLDALPASLRRFFLASSILLVAAALEAFVIGSRA